MRVLSAIIGVILAALALTYALAGPTTITVLDGNGNPKTYQVFTDGSGNFLGSVIACDPTSTTQCILINSLGQQTVIVTSTAITTSPLAVTIASSPVNITGSLSTTVSSPLGVNIASSPVNVTFDRTVSSPQNVTIGGVASGNFADGAINSLGSRADSAAVAATTSGSVISFLRGIFVNVQTPMAVTPQGSPATVVFSVSPVGVGIVNQPTVVLSGSPVSVGVVSSPLNVTLPASPLGVALAGPTPLNVTLAASPLNVSLTALPGTPVSIVDSATPDYVSQSLRSAPSITAYTVTSAFNVTATAVQIGTSAQHQLATIACTMGATLTTPGTVYLQVFNATSGGVTLGTTLPSRIVSVSGSPTSAGLFTAIPPGDQYSTGITVAATSGPKNSSSIGTNMNCSFSYN